MKIEIIRTGGFSGMMRQAIADTCAMTPEARAQLESLVVESDFFRLPRRLEGAERGADRFEYEIRIRRGLHVHAVRGREDALPAALVRLAKMVLRGGTELASADDGYNGPG